MIESNEIGGTANVPPKVRPDISRLPDAFELDLEGRPQPRFRAGDDIIIERHSIVLPSRPWLSTDTFMVQDIDQETGHMRLWHRGLQQYDMSNYVTGILKHGIVYKLARGNESVKRKRGRPRKILTDTQAAPEKSLQDAPRITGRGRPKGSKNRSKEVIAEEKRAKAELKKKRKT